MVSQFKLRSPFDLEALLMPGSERDDSSEHADPAWFREPTRRERWIAAALFLAFGVWFVALFIVQRGWSFRWVILGLGVISMFNGIRHVIAARSRATT